MTERMVSTTRMWAVGLALLVMVPAALREARAQEVARDRYLKHVPLGAPRLVQQTAASAALHLYGDRADPGYRDDSPVDGIDDARYQILLSLVVGFAPYLVQNTTNMPTNFDVYIENRNSFPLRIDRWDITGVEPELIGSRSVDFSALGGESCPTSLPNGKGGQLPSKSAAEDCKLVEILDEFAPGGPPPTVSGESHVRPRPDLAEVMFFDFPGEGPGTWEKAYKPEYEATPEQKRRFFPHAYVHPFLRDVRDEQGQSRGYELILQYWFFYPSNDSGNNHEGDWEHMNVVVAPRSMVEAPLPAATIQRILSGELTVGAGSPDPLVIQRLEYYFHHFVMTLDFANPNVYTSRDDWEAEIRTRPQPRFQESEMWKNIRRLAYVDDEETTVNTHPIGYIGADNKGLNQILAAPGGRNRDAHGTYPFPGHYHNVAPGATTDQISVSVDPRKYWQKLARGKASAGPDFERGRVLGLADEDRLRIVPDWERIVDIARRDASGRRDWSWLLLPIRWGYPATESPFSGVLEHFDSGNVSPVGPSFNAGWNASGTAPGFSPYEPHTMPSVFPLGLQDSFRNDLGFLNLTVPLLTNLPPLDFATRIAAYPFKLAFGRRDPVYYPKDGIPFRFVGLSSGVSVQTLDDDYSGLALNPQQFDEFILRLALHLATNGFDSTTTVVGGGDSRSKSVQPFYQIAFYIGGHFASENTVRNVRSDYGVTLDFNNIPSYTYQAEVNYWEYAGSIRYSLSTSRLQPFLKGGYGWSWYRLENARANGEPFGVANSDWIKPKHFWPNVWHLGLGVEVIPWKRVGKVIGGLEVAFRVEYARYYESLGLDLSSIPLSELGLIFSSIGDVPGGERVHRDDFLFGMTVSF